MYYVWPFIISAVVSLVLAVNFFGEEIAVKGGPKAALGCGFLMTPILFGGLVAIGWLV